MKARRRRTMRLGAFLALALASPGLAAEDDEIRQRIEKRLREAGLDQQSDVAVSVEAGAVTLTGVALSLPARIEIEKLARRDADEVFNLVRVFVEEPRPDREIREAVIDAILRYPRYTVFDHVALAVEDGAVLLTGSVRHPWRRKDIESRVVAVPGIRDLDNQIQVQSISPHDERLRLALAQRIYGDPRFSQYAHRTHPPIRILVDRGRVTLAGVVVSRVEQVVLGHIAREFPVFEVDNQLQVESEIRDPEDRKREDDGT